jgi:UDP-glucose:(heptosyl)LPS alpha-1,3-glucosyltransferase
VPSPACPKKKIAVVIPKYGLAGGAERFAAILAERLAENPAYEIHVLANRWASSSTVIFFHHIPIITFPRFLTTISFAWFANRTVAKLGCDLVHAHDRILHADLFSMHGVPHRFWIREIRRKQMSLFDRVTAWVEARLINDPHCRWLLPVSTLAQEQYCREFPEARERLQVIHPGIDLERFNPLRRQERGENIRKKFGFAASDFIVLFVGMNFELKGLRTTIAAVAHAQKKSPNQKIKLLVVGKGNQQKFRRLSSELTIQESVIFAGVLTEGMEDIYAAADTYALLSDFDTFGMTVLEAMAAGLPVIISPSVGAKDLVTEGINGYIVEQNDDTAAGDKIIFLLDKQRRNSMGQAALLVAEQHSWDNVTKKISQLYDEILTSQ